MGRNPFEIQRSVEPEDMVGRQELLDELVRHMTRDEGLSCALIGGSRCGKSTLLRALASKLRQPATWARGDYQILAVNVSLYRRRPASAEAVFAQLLDEVRRRVDGAEFQRPADGWPQPVALEHVRFRELAAQDELAYDDFEQAVGYVLDQVAAGGTSGAAGQGVRLVLLLDDFQETFGRPWADDLAKPLRVLLSESELRHRVRLVVSGSQPILDQLSEQGAPLYNMLEPTYLYALDRAAVDGLAARGGGFGAEVVDAVWAESGGHPLIAQYLCYQLWEVRQRTGGNGVAVAQVAACAETFCHDHRSTLAGWVQRLEASGRLAYEVLLAATGWVSEEEILQAIGAQTPQVARGLTALCYHGLAVHEDWRRYRQAGALFGGWYGANGRGVDDEDGDGPVDAQLGVNVQIAIEDHSSRAVYDQRGQRVDGQTNVVGDVKGGDGEGVTR